MAAALVAGSVLSAVNAVLRDRMEELFNTVATAIRDRETFMYNLQTVSEINTGRTALHVAAVNGIVDLAERLVGASQPERLALPDAYGDTPLSLAAYSGSFAIVKLLLRKNENLISIPNTKRKVIPVVAACNEGHKHITKYLYHRTELDLLRSENGYYGSMLLSSAVKNDMLDIALDLVQRCPDLIFSGNDATLGLLSTLAETPSLFLSGCQLGFAQRLDYHLRIHIKLPTPWNEQRNIGIEEQERPNELETQREGMKKVFLFRRSEQMYEMKRKHVFAREILRIIAKRVSTPNATEPQLNAAKEALFRAVKNGIPEFVNEMIRACPALLFSVDGNQRNMIMSAIEHRQEEIFSLIFALDAIKYEITSATDKYGNNMLHLAGLLSPPDRLARASGAALQMQRELQWFKEVESMMSTISKESRNEDGQTPYQVFIKHHRQLMIDGEKWMQGTATTFSTVVGALIITIMFTAAITVPGGTDQNSGYPIFLHKRSFIVFIISDVLSLFAASISVSMFLAILTSGYTEKDFLRPLPEKLFYGLLTLCISMAAMIIAFCAALFIMLKEKPYIVIPISLAATVPVSLFFKMQLGLLKEIWFSTIGPGIFNKKRA